MWNLRHALFLALLFMKYISTSYSFHMENVIVDCVSQNLSSVPGDLPSTAEAVDLSMNHIQTLKRQDFIKTPRLRFLNISWNFLQDIHPKAFHSTPSLESLDLSHNRLQNLSNQEYLLQVSGLQHLDLSFNKFLFMTLGVEFSGLRDLRYLTLSAERIRNADLQSIAYLNIQRLTLHLENLKSYENRSLSVARAKKVMLTMNNTGLDQVIIADALGSFKVVELSGISASYLREMMIKREAIKVTHLHLSDVQTTWGELTTVVNAILQSPIQQLSLSNITFIIMDRGSKVSETSSLQSFSIWQASVKTFIFHQDVVYDFFINMPAESITLAQSPIIHMTCPHSPSRVRALDMSGCTLSENVFSSVTGVECKTLVQMEILILRNNNLRLLRPLSSRVQFMSALRYLDLGQNALTYKEAQGSCLWPPNLTQIDLSTNSFDEMVFKCLPTTIVELNLQNNQIVTVPANISTFYALVKLDLTANRLLDLPNCQGFPGLRVLSVHGNSIHSISPDVMETCQKLWLLDASRNPYICTCALRKFTTLLHEGRVQTGRGQANPTLQRWPMGYRCSYPDSWHKKTLEEFYLPEVSCNAGLLAVTILVPAVILVIMVATLCFKLDAPWYLSMIWKWTRVKRRAGMGKNQAENLEGVHFHAFVSYSQRDTDWVKGQLLPKLEGEDPASHGALQVCHHERNFIPGRTIVQNILACVEQSRRSIFVLSSHFVQSEWCNYELYYASHQQLMQGMDSIILILLEPIPRYLIPSKYPQLISMMARRTYLEWPQEKSKQRLFWANIRAALQANLPAQRDPQEDSREAI